MEAAKVLAEREYKVVLFEKGSKLGGNLNVADKPPFKEKLTWLADTMTEELKRLGVEVRLDTAATVEDVAALSPVGVFLAAGARPIRIPIPGIDGDNVATAEDVLTGKATVGKAVAVIGSGLTGIETAEALAEKGHAVTLVEALPAIGPSVNPNILYDVTTRLNKYNTTYLPAHKLMAISNGAIVLLKARAVNSTVVATDSVVLAIGVSPDAAFTQQFREKFERVVVVGDNVKGGRIADAINDGFSKAFAFEA
jgi:NADPH-dependent 2,4-dienoyl-CoA reductase/sulfur reductase-like enzyme